MTFIITNSNTKNKIMQRRPRRHMRFKHSTLDAEKGEMLEAYQQLKTFRKRGEAIRKNLLLLEEGKKKFNLKNNERINEEIEDEGTEGGDEKDKGDSDDEDENKDDDENEDDEENDKNEEGKIDENETEEDDENENEGETDENEVGEGDNIEEQVDEVDINIIPPPMPENQEIKLNPFSGSHRTSKNAIFAFAQGYDLGVYVSFLESLRATGYADDVVLSISADASQDVLEYLKSQDNVIAYVDKWDCVNGKGESVSNPGEGMYKCKIKDLYYNTNNGMPEEDTRVYRPVATARYELYYAWSTQYSNDSWILLIDSRDTYFQENPFSSLETPPKKQVLMLFEENRESVTLGKSSFNSRWLRTAYGSDTAQKFSSLPVICSGSTIGTNLYIQIYLKAMIQQFDITKCLLKGCDQGFHNYLYYSHKLSELVPSDHIQLFEQGKGLINNLAALRDKPLKEWGLLSEEKSNYQVLNWDKSVSVIAHQGDRDKEFSGFLRRQKRQKVADIRKSL